ncbi:DUF6880 family protein [Azospirillum canadense]|uniref:DUF6880 family protein n=1 Tax=Azospirillum canadense TaxID=403962 RepID=UPI002227C9BD|nr:DUF6880 family protein [Azospirillum canadense]MCW2241787.1 hypothetical protein [Azospirillum canadense]
MTAHKDEAMARGKEITADKLEALGAKRLADLLAELAAADPVVRKAAKLALAAGESPTKLVAAIDKRLRTIARSKSFIAWDKRKPLVQELDNLRTTIVATLAPVDARAAAERMVDFLNLSDTLYERVDDGAGTVAVFRRAVEDLGRLWAQLPAVDPEALARLALALLRSNEYGVKDGVVSALGPALGADGRARLKAMLQEALGAAPKARGKDRGFDDRRFTLAQALAELADVEDDVDGFIAAVQAQGSGVGDAVAVAKRLLKAGRAQDALAWLDRVPDRRRNPDLEELLYFGGWPKDEATDLRIAALDALGRKDEAQRLRWTSFTETLDADHLRDFLKRLPDFEDFEAEEKAKEIARRFPDPHRALAFFVAWRDVHGAAQLVRERLEEFDGRDYRTLPAAAEALAGKHPVAATLLYRRMIESILGRASASQYGYAVRDVRHCESLAGQLPEDAGIESHDAFMARLRQEHGRKAKFWELLRDGG